MSDFLSSENAFTNDDDECVDITTYPGGLIQMHVEALEDGEMVGVDLTIDVDEALDLIATLTAAIRATH